MKTKQIYIDDSYKKEMNATVLEVKNEGEGRYRLLLDNTVFYPMGGGQATDQGDLSSKNWKGVVYQVLNKDGEIWHFIKSDKAPNINNETHGVINWERRYKNMKLHSGGHIVDFAMYLLGYSPKTISPVKADHDKNPHIVYKGKVGKDVSKELEEKANEIIKKDLKFSWYFQPFEDLKKEAIYLQPGLPTNKPLRTLKLEGVGAVADGGTQVKKTGEVGKIQITEIIEDDGNTIVKYSVIS